MGAYVGCFAQQEKSAYSISIYTVLDEVLHTYILLYVFTVYSTYVRVVLRFSLYFFSYPANSVLWYWFSTSKPRSVLRLTGARRIRHMILRFEVLYYFMIHIYIKILNGGVKRPIKIKILKKWKKALKCLHLARNGNLASGPLPPAVNDRRTRLNHPHKRTLTQPKKHAGRGRRHERKKRKNNANYWNNNSNNFSKRLVRVQRQEPHLLMYQ